MRRCLALLWFALLASQALASEQVLRDCVARVDSQSVGVESLDADCPGLADAVEKSDYYGFIGEDQAQQLTRDSLSDLLALQAHYQERDAVGPSIDPTTVGAALQGLQRPPPPAVKPKSWWDLFEEWLTEGWSAVSKQDNWLTRWLKRAEIPDKILSGLFTVVSLFILAVAVAILVVELRAAGVFARRRALVASAAPAPAVAAPLTLADLDAAAAGERIALLFKLLIVALRHGGRLQSDRAMTHRELTRRASFDAEAQRQQFGEISVLAERTLFGGRSASEAELEQALQNGRALYAQLSQPANPAGEHGSKVAG